MNSNSSDCDFSLLPPHVITHIFQYLKFGQILNCARTCKLWYYASCDPVIWKNITVRIHAKKIRCQIDQFHRPFGILRLQRLKFNTLTFYTFYKKLFAKFGPYIREIHFDYCNLSLQQLFDCLICLTNLVTLKLYIRGPIFTSKIKLNNSDKEIIRKNLNSVRDCVLALDVPDKGPLHFIMSCMPNIKSLRFDRCGFSFLVFKSLFDYFNMFAQEVNLNYLQLSEINSPHEFMARFAKITQQLNIVEVILESIIANYDENFAIFCKKLSNVRSLTIFSPTENQLGDICRYMINLTALNLNGLTDQNLRPVKYLHHLEKLTLRLKRGFTLIALLELSEDVLMEVFPRLGNLKELTTNYPITQRTLEVLCLNCKGLTRLVLFRLRTNNFEFIFKHLTNLECLTLVVVFGLV